MMNFSEVTFKLVALAELDELTFDSELARAL